MRKIALFSIIFLLAVGILFGIVRFSSTSKTGSFVVTFLDIGQGDATFITFPDSKQMLIDCGLDARILPALFRVMPFYDKTIDYLVITHPDKDHYGGCIDVLKRFDVREIIYNGMTKEDDESYDSFLEAVILEESLIHEIRSQVIWEDEDTKIHYVYPDTYLSERLSDNNGSIVMLFDVFDVKMLLTGDIEKEIEYYLLDRYDLDVDLLKVAHHGSDSSSVKEFIASTTPKHAVISAGQGNSYGHPSRRVIKRLERFGSQVWRTDMHGDITVVIDEKGMVVTPSL